MKNGVGGPLRFLAAFRQSRGYLIGVGCAFAIAFFATGFRLSAQAASTDLHFEVATVKPVDPSKGFTGYHFWAHVYPGRASYWSMSVRSLIEYAYGIEVFQVTGPDWTHSDLFDIEATIPEGAEKKADLKMMQALLKDRFKLSFHIEKKDLDVYVLEVDKHGPKLKPSLPDTAAPEAAPAAGGDDHVAQAPARPKAVINPDGSSTIDMGIRGTQTVKTDRENSSTIWTLSKMTMEQLAGRLSVCIGSGVHKVVDETGIKGNYQVVYNCPMPTMPSSGDSGASALPSAPQGGSTLNHSLEAMGLKLEKRKVPTDVYVIDHVEKPTEN